MGYTEKWRLNSSDFCYYCEIECEDLKRIITNISIKKGEFLCSGCNSKRLINEQ